MYSDNSPLPTGNNDRHTININQLHDRLTESFRACGIRNNWVADDILISLQHCLDAANSQGTQPAFDGDQINATLIKVLQDNGFPQIAEHFNQNLLEGTLGALKDKIDRVLVESASPVQANCAPRIMQKVLSLGYPAELISPLLIREIALLETRPPKSSKDEIDGAVTSRLQGSLPFAARFVNWDWDFLQLRCAGTLFNSIRIDIYPLKLSESQNYTPFMEMLFLSEWQQIIGKAANYLKTCLATLQNTSKEKVDYISIVAHQTNQFLNLNKLHVDSPFLLELKQSLEKAFGSLIKNNPQIIIRGLQS